MLLLTINILHILLVCAFMQMLQCYAFHVTPTSNYSYACQYTTLE